MRTIEIDYHPAVWVAVVSDWGKIRGGVFHTHDEAFEFVLDYVKLHWTTVMPEDARISQDDLENVNAYFAQNDTDTYAIWSEKIALEGIQAKVTDTEEGGETMSTKQKVLLAAAAAAVAVVAVTVVYKTANSR
jgi:uncharacterized protein YbdZ (MbtH family)